MPLLMSDVTRILGPSPIVDPNSVFTEILRRFPMGGQELEGIKKDMVITRVVKDILEQPQISGQSKWEDRFLYGKAQTASRTDIAAWMKKSQKPLSIQPREYENFFTWLKSFDNSPWQIEDIDSLHKTVRVMDKGRGILTSIPFDAAMNYLRKTMGWSDADVFEYWDFKKSQMLETAEVSFRELFHPGGYQLVYTPEGEAEGFVAIQKSMLANKSFIAPDLRGREVVTVTHHNQHGGETELGTFYGMDADHEAYRCAKSFANKMAKCNAPFSPKKKKGEMNKSDGFESDEMPEPKPPKAPEVPSPNVDGKSDAMMYEPSGEIAERGLDVEKSQNAIAMLTSTVQALYDMQKAEEGGMPVQFNPTAGSQRERAGFPLGSVRTEQSGGQVRKVAQGQWVPHEETSMMSVGKIPTAEKSQGDSGILTMTAQDWYDEADGKR